MDSSIIMPSSVNFLNIPSIDTLGATISYLWAGTEEPARTGEQSQASSVAAEASSRVAAEAGNAAATEEPGKVSKEESAVAAAATALEAAATAPEAAATAPEAAATAPEAAFSGLRVRVKLRTRCVPESSPGWVEVALDMGPEVKPLGLVPQAIKLPVMHEANIFGGMLVRRALGDDESAAALFEQYKAESVVGSGIVSAQLYMSGEDEGKRQAYLKGFKRAAGKVSPLLRLPKQTSSLR